MHKIRKKQVLGATAVLSLALMAVTLSKLVLQDFPSRGNFAGTYFLYSISAFSLCHTGIFFLNQELKDLRGKGLSKDVPRYIDYLITVLLAIGLAQILFSEDLFAKYIEQVSGNKSEIVANIKRQARAHLKDDCGKKGGIHG